MGVLALWRYPVKAMLGEALERVRVAAGGLEGDRRWAVQDAVTGERIAAKRGPTDPRLRACRARITADGEPAVTLPDGSTVAGVAAVEEALSVLLQRHVALSEHPGGGDGYMRTGGHHDFAPLHVLTARALADMRRVAPTSDWDVRRFRPNLVLAGGPAEPDLVGGELRAASGLRLRLGLPTPRCVVPTRAREQLPHDPGLLKQIARRNMWQLGPFGRGACLGTYAEVVQGGRIAVGEEMAFAPGSRFLAPRPGSWEYRWAPRRLTS